MSDLLDRIRSSCARVASVSTHVTIDHDRIATYASELDVTPPVPDPGQMRVGDDESTAAFVLTLDAINFGSGYFPHLRKREGMSGYHTVATALRDRTEAHGPPTTSWLTTIDAAECAAIFGQDRHPGPAMELMGLFARALRDLGSFVDDIGEGSFLDVVAEAGGSAPALVEMLDVMPFYRDVHQHPSGEVLLYKRAQITAQDLALAFDNSGPGDLEGLDQLTMFADNLVPHVLRVDGVLRFAPELIAHIDAGENIPVGSVEEVEIRACGLHAVELLVGALGGNGAPITAGALDNVLWNRGAGDAYKSCPRHRSRCVFY